MNSIIKNRNRNTIIVLVFVFLSVLHTMKCIECGNYKTEINEQLKINKQLKDKNVEIETLKSEPIIIKDQSSILKHDIELYIKTTHRKISSIVAKEIAKCIVEKSTQYKIAPELILGIIKVESSFNPAAVGSKTKYGHARGLMQVMPEWAPKLNLKSQYDFHEIDIAIESGIKVFLIHLEEAKGDISTGLYYYVNHDKKYVGHVYEAIGKFVAFRSTINIEKLNIKKPSEYKKGEKID